MTILNRHINEFEIFILQEPNWSFIGRNDGKPVLGPVNHPSWTPIAPTTIADQAPRVFTYVKKHSGIQVTLRTDIADGRDIQVLDISAPGIELFTVINIYNDGRMGRGGAAWQLRNANIPSDRPVMLTGDWNIHHNDWSARTVSESTITQEIVTWLSEGAFHRKNKKGELTYIPHNKDALPSVLDLSFVNAHAFTEDTFKYWAVDSTYQYTSDHLSIKWIIDPDTTEIHNVSGERYSLKEVKPEEWIEAYMESIREHEDAILPLQNQGATLDPRQLDEATRAITMSMQAATERVGSIRKPCPKAQPWWSTDLDAAAEKVHQAREIQAAHERAFGSPDRRLKATVTKARNYFKRRVKLAKRAWVDSVVEETTLENSYGLRKWGNGTRNYPTPPIYRGNGQPMAVTQEEKSAAIRETLYQRGTAIEQQYPIHWSLPSEVDNQFTDVTETEVREALFKTSGNTAPGFSQMSFKVVRWAWQANSVIIVNLVRHCLRVGYHPRDWRRAIAVVLRKPNKPDYSNPRAYRLITLLECLGKVLERVVARRLTFLAGQKNIIPCNQFGGRSNYSTNDAILSFTHDVQAAWNHGKVTTALTFDIKGYFDFVDHNRLLHEMRRLGLPLPYVKWTASFLKDREAAICLDGVRGLMEPVENGIPQGSPVSPILAAFYTAELLQIFEQEFPADPQQEHQPSKTSLFMFVDDGKVSVSSKTLQKNIEILQIAYSRIAQWLKSAGLLVDTTKRELLHYMRGKISEALPSIVLEDDDGTFNTIEPSSIVKWLGVYFDGKLLFNEHVKRRTAKAANAVQGLTMLANTVRGLSQYNLRHLYKTCIIPAMTYASPVWWTGKKVHLQQLEKVQNRALRLICAAFRTTPIHALEIEASVPPIRHWLDKANRSCALRLNKLSTNNPIIHRLDDRWRCNQPPPLPPPLPPRPVRSRTEKKTTQLLEIAKLANPNDEVLLPFACPPWRRVVDDFPLLSVVGAPKKKEEKGKEKAAKEHLRHLQKIQGQRHLIIYTDGSMRPLHSVKRVGAGVVGYYQGREVFTRKIGMGSRAEVYDAEILALTAGIAAAVKFTIDNPQIRHWHFFSDNTAAVTSIFDPSPKPGQLYCKSFYDKASNFLDNYPLNTIEIAWVPGHQSVKGNERADTLAKEAVAMSSQEPATRAHALRMNRFRAKRAWVREWRARPRTGRFAIANRLEPTLEPTKRLRETEREIFGRLTQCRTGHSFTGEYFSSFSIPETVECPCGEPLQTREHILRECNRYETHRDVLRKVSFDISLPEILGSEKGIAALADFIRKSGAFSKNGVPSPDRTVPPYEEEPEAEERALEEEEGVEEERGVELRDEG